MNHSASFNFDDEDEEVEVEKSRTSIEALPSVSQLEQNQNPLDILLKAYLDRLEEYPLVTKSITCAFVSVLGSLLGTIGSSQPRIQPKGKQPDSKPDKLRQISEIAAFALYGGLVGGPLTHYWNRWLEDNTQQSQRSTSWNLLVDQLIAQPPMLFLMHLVLDMSGAAVRELPKAWNRSLERTGHSLVRSWRFWPVAVYIILYLAKKRRHVTIGLNLAGVYWMSKIARLRSTTPDIHH